MVLDRLADEPVPYTKDVGKWYPESVSKAKLEELGERGRSLIWNTIRVFNGDPQRQLWHGLIATSDSSFR